MNMKKLFTLHLDFNENLLKFNDTLMILSNYVSESLVLYIITILLYIIWLSYIVYTADRPGIPVNRPRTPEDRPNQWLGQNVPQWWNANSRIVASPTLRRQMPVYNALTKRQVFEHEPGYIILAEPGPLGLLCHEIGNTNINKVNRFIILNQDNISPEKRSLTYFRFLGIVHTVKTEHLYTFDQADFYLQGCLIQAITQYGDIPNDDQVPTHEVGKGILNTWYRNYHEPTTNGHH